jgi:putative methionine-R-sulfoxide reductase with GAF domain
MSEELNEAAKEIQEMQQLKGRPSRARYDRAHATLDRKWRRRELKAERMMREVIDVLWDNFAQSPYSWCGFYLISPDGSQLMLGPHRDKPACSPLALHGVCGQVFKSGNAMIVPDVKALGAAHIECDPKNQSEIAVPVFNREGKVFGVLDVDSYELGAFDEMDQRWLERLLRPFQDAGKPA